MSRTADEKAKGSAEFAPSEVLRYLQDERFHYLTAPGKERQVVDPNATKRYGNAGIGNEEIILYQIEEITYDDKDHAPRKEALENVLSAVRVPGYNFIYLLMGDSHGVKFYYGLNRVDSDAMPEIQRLNVPEVGESILKASLEGNFRGCKIKEPSTTEKNNVLEKVRTKKFVSRIEGVAGSIKDNEEFQGVDRLVDVMRGNDFCVLIVAQAIQPEEIAALEQNLHEAYSELNTYVKVSLQDGSNSGSSSSITKTDGATEGSSTSTAKSSNVSNEHNQSTTKGTSSSGSSSTSNIGTEVSSHRTQPL